MGVFRNTFGKLMPAKKPTVKTFDFKNGYIVSKEYAEKHLVKGMGGTPKDTDGNIWLIEDPALSEQAILQDFGHHRPGNCVNAYQKSGRDENGLAHDTYVYTYEGHDYEKDEYREDSFENIQKDLVQYVRNEGLKNSKGVYAFVVDPDFCASVMKFNLLYKSRRNPDCSINSEVIEKETPSMRGMGYNRGMDKEPSFDVTQYRYHYKGADCSVNVHEMEREIWALGPYQTVNDDVVSKLQAAAGYEGKEDLLEQFAAYPNVDVMRGDKAFLRSNAASHDRMSTHSTYLMSSDDVKERVENARQRIAERKAVKAMRQGDRPVPGAARDMTADAKESHPHLNVNIQNKRGVPNGLASITSESSDEAQFGE